MIERSVLDEIPLVNSARYNRNSIRIYGEFNFIGAFGVFDSDGKILARGLLADGENISAEVDYPAFVFLFIKLFDLIRNVALCESAEVELGAVCEAGFGSVKDYFAVF